MSRRRVIRSVVVVLSFLAVIGVFLGIVEPWFINWGATDEEVGRPLPGDEIIPDAHRQGTRAITIHAPVAVVWPWLAQIGRDRGGFYSFDLLENLVGCEMPTVDELQPEMQSWKIGDKLWMYPADKAGGIGFATLRSHVPGRALGFATRAFGVALTEPENGSWTFVLEPSGNDNTRVLIRGRMAEGRSLAWRIFDRLVFDPMHFVMERRMMIGLKQLAEGRSRARLENHAQAALWIPALGLAVAALILAVRRTRWIRGVIGFIMAAAVFQILTFGQPSVLAGILLIAFVAAILPWKRSLRAEAAQWILRNGSHVL